MSDELFCFRCDAARDCEVERGCGMTIWRCPTCGGIVDEDYDEMEDDPDGIDDIPSGPEPCYICGRERTDYTGLLCDECRRKCEAEEAAKVGGDDEQGR